MARLPLPVAHYPSPHYPPLQSWRPAEPRQAVPCRAAKSCVTAGALRTDWTNCVPKHVGNPDSALESLHDLPLVQNLFGVYSYIHWFIYSYINWFICLPVRSPFRWIIHFVSEWRNSIRSAVQKNGAGSGRRSGGMSPRQTQTHPPT